MNFLRTKPFCIATAGATIDGRVIDDKLIDEMASSYDPATYTARLNIEHIRGISGDGPFRAYGDVMELSTGEVDVNFNGKIEKRKALYAVFEVNEDAKKLNDAGQKLFSSVEIEDNFCGKGFAYLAGCAMTDSPAAIATDRMKFSRNRPNSLIVPGETSAALEFADDKGNLTTETGGFLHALTGVLEKFTGAKKEPEPAAQPQPAPAGTIDMTALTGLFTDLGKTLDGALQAQATTFRGEIDQIALSVKKLTSDVETTAAPGQQSRPLSNGQNFAVTDC